MTASAKSFSARPAICCGNSIQDIDSTPMICRKCSSFFDTRSARAKGS